MILSDYINFLRRINGISDEEKELPSAIDDYRRYRETVKELLTADEDQKLKKLQGSMKDTDDLVLFRG